jgi:hypothetical protein
MPPRAPSFARGHPFPAPTHGRRQRLLGLPLAGRLRHVPVRASALRAAPRLPAIPRPKPVLAAEAEELDDSNDAFAGLRPAAKTAP